MLARFSAAGALVALAAMLAAAPARAASDMETCADQRTSTEVLTLPVLAAAEAACSRVLATGPRDADRQKAAFYRGLMRFLQVMGKGAANIQQSDGSVDWSPPTLEQVRDALTDMETAIGLEGPLKGDAITTRVAINQVIGRTDDANAGIEQAMKAAPNDPTPYVQRGVAHERAGDIGAAIADFDRAIELDPKRAAALSMRGNLLRGLGLIDRARADFIAAAALGPPIRSLALTSKAQVEVRLGNLRAAYDDFIAAAREEAPLATDDDAKEAAALLYLTAADLALDKLKEIDAAEALYLEAQKLTPKGWSPVLGLARVEERRGNEARAIALYRRVMAGTGSTPKLYERGVASLRLKLLLKQLPSLENGFFRSAMQTTVEAKKSADGLKRLAFVIGSSDYTELASLPNARRDAAVMANALAEMGFDEVEVAENLGKADLRSLPGIIAERAAKADVVLVFYAGHGVETDGANYLVPIDAVPDSDKALRNDTLALADLTAAAAKAKRGALVIIDACRDDPFIEARAVAQSRSASGSASQSVPSRRRAGLAAPPSIARNNIVFHSTQPGQTAQDGDGLQSPFVRSLLETLGTPGQRLDAVVKQTATRVSDRTDGKQVPAVYGTAPTIALLPPAAKR